MKQPNMRLIHHVLEHSAEVYPHKTALVQDDQRSTFAELNTRANSLAKYLMQVNINKGDHIAILWENSAEFVISYYGVLKAGAVASPLGTDLKPDGLREILRNLAPRLIIASKRFARLLKACGLTEHQSRLLIQDVDDTCLAGMNGVDDWAAHTTTAFEKNIDLVIEEDALANIIFTSGSTALPKGVMLSHHNILCNTSSICEYLHLTERDKHMVVLPFFYVMGLSILNTHFYVGGSLVINNHFAYPASVIDQMIREQVTGFSGVPSTYAFLLHRSPLLQKSPQFTSLRYCAQAGGHMQDKIKHDLRQALPNHVEIYIMYGATEAAARLSYLEPKYFETKMGSIGKAIPGVVIRILDSEGNTLTPGEVGEIVAAGENIMLGYLNNQDSTRQVLSAKGYHTGDLGFQDEDGFFYVLGRKDSVLKVGGHRINPQEIESSILDTNLVAEVAVFGMPDDLLGNRLIALTVVKHEGIDEKALLLACHQKLPKFKLPSEIKILKALPTKSNGKLDATRFVEAYQSAS